MTHHYTNRYPVPTRSKSSAAITGLAIFFFALLILLLIVVFSYGSVR